MLHSTPIDRVLSKLADAKENGERQWQARCPAHDDKNPSLSITVGDNDGALLHCFAGCSTDAICRAIGMTTAELFNNPSPPGHVNYRSKSKPIDAPTRTRIVTSYNYCDEVGAVLFQAVRYEPKSFRQRRPDGKGGWTWSVKGVRTVPYRLPELLADTARPVVIAEGEKDSDNLARIGVMATTNAGGAGKWSAEHSAFLRGRQVLVLPDNDEAGRNHAQQVAQSLHGIAESVRIVELPGLPAKCDASDWIAAGGTKEELKRLAEAAPVWTPAAAQPWPEIVSFDVLDLPDFPTHGLPDVLRRWVEAESHATQTPADLAGLLALAVCSACIARRVEVEPRPGWPEPVNLFVAVLLEPGSRKSAVFTDATKPLHDLEAELIEAARPVVARAESDRRQELGRLRTLEKAAEKGDAEARRQAGDLAAELAQQGEPALPQLIVDDATAEKLGMILAQQGGRVASMSPEGGVFDLMAGLYSKSGFPQFGVYLMGHSGDDLNTDRVSRKSVRVERPALTCAYAMQPQVVEGLAENSAFRGRGLLARFLYATPRSWIGERLIAPEPVPDTTRLEYRQAVRTLAAIEGETILHLTADASAELIEWETEIETMLADGGDMETVRDWGAKLAGATLRLAAVLHCVQYVGGNGTLVEAAIGEATIASAIEIARYLIPHADAVLTKMAAKDNRTDADAQYVLRWIVRNGRREFSKSEAHHHGKHRFGKAPDLDAPMAELVERGYIRRRLTPATGPGRPTELYEVNPAVPTQGKSKPTCKRPGVTEARAKKQIGSNGNERPEYENSDRLRVAV
jgi:Protein of unknown function (DUF3987)